jgi:glycosyltransferase involved in cell wall biosynthesis
MIEILMATYNGEPFIHEQLDSIIAQSYSDWTLLIHDDGSQDATVDIVKKYAKKDSRIRLLEDGVATGGASANFGHLMAHSSAEYISFCDQDDVWMKDKLQACMQKMIELEAKHGMAAPLLVHTDLKPTDIDLKPMSHSFWAYEHIDPRKNSLNRLLMQNVVTGNTMLINKTLVSKALPIPKDAIMHDWWIALVASAFGAIYPISKQMTLYRQHGKNDVGAKNFSAKYVLKRFVSIFITGEDRYLAEKYSAQARAFVDRFGQYEIASARALAQLSSLSTPKRKIEVLKHRLFKQGFLRNIGLMLTI